MGFFSPDQIIQSATVTLTDEQIKALPSGDFNIIPPVAGGQIIVPVSGRISSSLVSPYTNVSGSGTCTWILWFRNGGNPFAIGATDLVLVDASFTALLSPIPRTHGVVHSAPVPNQATFGVNASVILGAVSGADVDLTVATAQTTVPFSDTQLVPGDAMDLHTDNAGLGNFTGGDPANTLKVTVLYSVLDV